jgi:predicted small secreted protein/DNA/RNA endonuclease YhcR with UshA esterase domain
MSITWKQFVQSLTAGTLSVVLVGGLTGCNTVEGAGQDIESVGSAMGAEDNGTAEQRYYYDESGARRYYYPEEARREVRNQQWQQAQGDQWEQTSEGVYRQQPRLQSQQQQAGVYQQGQQTSPAQRQQMNDQTYGIEDQQDQQFNQQSQQNQNQQQQKNRQQMKDQQGQQGQQSGQQGQESGQQGQQSGQQNRAQQDQQDKPQDVYGFANGSESFTGEVTEIRRLSGDRGPHLVLSTDDGQVTADLSSVSRNELLDIKIERGSKIKVDGQVSDVDGQKIVKVKSIQAQNGANQNQSPQ